MPQKTRERVVEVFRLLAHTRPRRFTSLAFIGALCTSLFVINAGADAHAQTKSGPPAHVAGGYGHAGLLRPQQQHELDACVGMKAANRRNPANEYYFSPTVYDRCQSLFGAVNYFGPPATTVQVVCRIVGIGLAIWGPEVDALKLGLSRVLGGVAAVTC